MRYLFIAVLFFSCFSSFSIEMKSLYRYQQPVEDKSRDTRLDASKQALLKVLTKVSGNPDISNNLVIKQKTANIANFISKFEYDETQQQLHLNIVFDQTRVDQLIKQAGLALWGNRRPLVVVWLAIEENWQRELITPENHPQIEQLIIERAKERGVPVVVPLLDLQDRTAVNVSDIWGGFSEPVNKASARYNAQKAVTGRMFQDSQSGVWQLDWRLTHDDHVETVRHSGDKQQIIVAMLDELTKRLANEYALKADNNSEAQALKLKIFNANNFVDLIKVKRRLLSLSATQQAELIQRSKDYAIYSINYAGNEQSLQSALALDSYFVPYQDASSQYGLQGSIELQYLWQP